MAVTMVEGPLAPPPPKVSETGCKTVFLKGMKGTNVRFTMQPSTGLGDAPTDASPGLGKGLQFL